MTRLTTVAIMVGLAITLGGCATEGAGEPEPTKQASETPVPTPDPSLLPSEAPADAVEVDPAIFDDGFGDLIFRVGDGPTWCTISTASQFVVCEQNEVAAQYEPIPVPDTCDYSYGYQLRLWANKPAEGDTAEFACSGGSYADPSQAQTLNSGEKISVSPFSCYVDEITARCENESGAWIALGPKVWGLNN